MSINNKSDVLSEISAKRALYKEVYSEVRRLLLTWDLGIVLKVLYFFEVKNRLQGGSEKDLIFSINDAESELGKRIPYIRGLPCLNDRV